MVSEIPQIPMPTHHSSGDSAEVIEEQINRQSLQIWDHLTRSLYPPLDQSSHSIDFNQSNSRGVSDPGNDSNNHAPNSPLILRASHISIIPVANLEQPPPASTHANFHNLYTHGPQSGSTLHLENQLTVHTGSTANSIIEATTNSSFSAGRSERSQKLKPLKLKPDFPLKEKVYFRSKVVAVRDHIIMKVMLLKV